MASSQPHESGCSDEMPSYFVLGRDHMFRRENYETKFGLDPDTIETSQDIPVGHLEKFEVDLISNVLNEVINQLTVVNNGQILDAPIVYKPPMAQRFTSVRERIWNEHTFERIDQELERLTMFELNKEIGVVINLLKKTDSELQTNGSYDSLKEYIYEHQRIEMEETNLIETYVYNKRQIKLLENKLQSTIEEHDILSRELELQEYELENQIGDCLIENRMKYHLVKKWEQSRFAQTKIKNIIAEGKLRDEHEYYLNELTRETSVHGEMEQYLTNCIYEIKKLTTYWTDRYDNETAALEFEIQITHDQIADIQAKCEDLTDKYNERQLHIDTYLEYRRKKEDEANRAKLKFDSCVKIQAWWRGTMVRRELGPYKKAKKKGKKSK